MDNDKKQTIADQINWANRGSGQSGGGWFNPWLMSLKKMFQAGPPQAQAVEQGQIQPVQQQPSKPQETLAERLNWAGKYEDK